KHDLPSQPPPAPPYGLVVCRNVVIYFDRAMQERLFTLFAEALTPGGVLLLGKVETLFGPARERLALEEPRERIYRLAGPRRAGRRRTTRPPRSPTGPPAGRIRGASRCAAAR